jgi:hypothetical protein
MLRLFPPCRYGDPAQVAALTFARWRAMARDGAMARWRDERDPICLWRDRIRHLAEAEPLARRP